MSCGNKKIKAKMHITIGMWVCIIAASICVALGIIEWLHGNFLFFGTTKSVVGLGDYGSFLQGTTASLWSLAGFFIILVAFLAQKQQLVSQQEQFEQQSFENHFFQLLTLQKDIVDDLTLKDGSFDGRRVFTVLHRKMESIYEERIDGQPVENDTEALAISCYESVFSENPEVLGHYFRTLYHIIKFVDESRIPDKKRYTSIVRAQLSTYEHALLHYNGLSEYGGRFKRHIESYSLLENMGANVLMNPKHPTAYSRNAFGEDANFFVFKGTA